MSAASLASGRAWVRMALPVSSAMMRASSSTRASTASAIFCSMRPRSRGTTLLQLGKALRRGLDGPIDVLGAAARDAGDDAGDCREFSTAIRSPEALSTQLPSISICMRLPEAAGALLIATAIAGSSLTSSLLGGTCRIMPTRLLAAIPPRRIADERREPMSGSRLPGACPTSRLRCCRRQARRACRRSRTSGAARRGTARQLLEDLLELLVLAPPPRRARSRAPRAAP